MEGERLEEHDCQLEWDKRRGVLYVHNKRTGATILRICGLKSCSPDLTLDTGLLDINLKVVPLEKAVSYPNEA